MQSPMQTMLLARLVDRLKFFLSHGGVGQYKPPHDAYPIQMRAIDGWK